MCGCPSGTPLARIVYVRLSVSYPTSGVRECSPPTKRFKFQLPWYVTSSTGAASWNAKEQKSSSSRREVGVEPGLGREAMADPGNACACPSRGSRSAARGLSEGELLNIRNDVVVMRDLKMSQRK